MTAATRESIAAPLFAFALLTAPLGACLAERSGDVGTTGGETHWMSPCDTDSECGPLACICGTCSFVCDDAGDCGGLPNAQCTLTCDDAASQAQSMCVPTIPAPDVSDTSEPDVGEDTFVPVDSKEPDDASGPVDVGNTLPDCPPGYDAEGDICRPHCNHDTDCNVGELCTQDCDDSCDQSLYPNPCCTRACVAEPPEPKWVCGTGDGTACIDSGECPPNAIQSASWGELSTWTCDTCCIPANCDAINSRIVCRENVDCIWTPAPCSGVGDFCTSPNEGECLFAAQSPCGAPPTAVINIGSSPSVLEPLTMMLSGGNSSSPSNNVVHYAWRVISPDGSPAVLAPSSTEQNPTFLAAAEGTYEVFLQVADACGARSAEVSVSVSVSGCYYNGVECSAGTYCGIGDGVCDSTSLCPNCDACFGTCVAD